MITKRILVVDDEQMIVNLCRKVLKAEGYEVNCSSRGDEAVALASKEQFNMVVTDMLMPGMNGVETFLAIKEKQPSVIGVMITGHGTIDTAIQAIGRGLSGFIRKPFLPQELVLVVKEAFQRSAIAEENTRLRSLLPLYELGERFILSQSREEILDGLIETLSNQTGAQRLSVMLYEEKEECLRIIAAKGIKKETAEKVRIRPGEKISGRVFQEGQPVILNGGPEDNPRFASFLKSKNIDPAILFPLKTRDRTLGVLNLSKLGKGSPFTRSDIEMVSIICRQAVMALDNLRMIEERAEKTRMRTLFEQYVAPEVAEILISHEKNPTDVGEITNLTVLFADIRNFTTLVQVLPLITLRSFLNGFFDLVTEIIFSFKGTLDKFMGDAVLALFGAPVRPKEPANEALNAAIMMLKVFEEHKETWKSKGQPLGEIGLGIGISSGEMFIGNVGSKQRFDYTVIGMDVNVAQRLATEAASGEILITQRVREQLGSKFHVAKESSRVLKGLEGPIPVFSISK